MAEDINSAYERGRRQRAEADAYGRANPPAREPSDAEKARSLAQAVASQVGFGGSYTLEQSGEEFIPDAIFNGALAELRRAGFQVKTSSTTSAYKGYKRNSATITKR